MDNQSAFAFIVHPRDYRDILSNIKITKFLPRLFVTKVLKYIRPFILSEIRGLKSLKDDKEVIGYIIGFPMLPHQMLENKDVAVKKIIQSIKLAEKLGAKMVGLGGLTSSITNGGLDLIDKTKANLTNGNALTVAVSLEHIKQLLKKINNPNIKIGIVGATGSIGQALTKLLTREYPKYEYLLFGRTKENLDNLIGELNAFSDKTRIMTFLNNLTPLKEADLVIVTTTASGAIIYPEHLKQNVIVYDTTQPQNVSQDVIKKRPDVLLINGGLIKIVDLKSEFINKLSKEGIYSCLVETILLSLEHRKENFSLGKVELDRVSEIYDLMKKYNFKPNVVI